MTVFFREKGGYLLFKKQTNKQQVHWTCWKRLLFNIPHLPTAVLTSMPLYSPFLTADLNKFNYLFSFTFSHEQMKLLQDQDNNVGDLKKKYTNMLRRQRYIPTLIPLSIVTTSMVHRRGGNTSTAHPLISPWVLTCLISHLLFCILTALSPVPVKENIAFQILHSKFTQLFILIFNCENLWQPLTALHMQFSSTSACICCLSQTRLKI